MRAVYNGGRPRQTDPAASTPRAAVRIVEDFLFAACHRDLRRAALAPDLILETPLGSGLRGIDAVADFLFRFASGVTGVRIRDHVVEGDLCTTRFDWETLDGPIPALGCFRLGGGALTEIRMFYNQREPGADPTGDTGLDSLLSTSLEAAPGPAISPAIGRYGGAARRGPDPAP